MCNFVCSYCKIIHPYNQEYNTCRKGMNERKKAQKNKDRKGKHGRRMTIGFSPHIF